MAVEPRTNNDFDQAYAKMVRNFPKWAKWREVPWHYCGYITPDGDGHERSQEQCIQEHIDAGPPNNQVREVDRYPEGVTYWCRRIK